MLFAPSMLESKLRLCNSPLAHLKIYPKAERNHFVGGWLVSVGLELHSGLLLTVRDSPLQVV